MKPILKQPHEITVLAPDSGPSEQGQKVNDWFTQSKAWYETKYRNEKINIVFAPIAEYESKMKEIQPDVVMSPYASLAKFHQQGLLLDLTPLVKADRTKLTDYYPEKLTQLTKIDNKLLGIPVATSPSIVVGYSKPWFDKAQLPYPKDGWTWEEFVETAKKLKAANAPSPEDTQISGATIGPISLIFEAMSLSKGSAMLSPDGTKGSGYLNSKAVIDAVQWVKDLAEVQHVIPPSSAPPSAYQASNLGKTTGMILYNYEIFDTMRRETYTNNEIGIAGMPHFKDGKRISNPNNLVFIGIAATSKNPDMGWKYIHGLTMDETELTQKAFEFTATVSLVAAKAFKVDQDPFMAVRLNELNYAEPNAYLFSPHWSSLVNDYLNNEIWRVFNGSYDVGNWLAQLAATTDRRIDDLNAKP